MKANTTGVTFVVVASFNQFGKDVDRPSTDYPVFDQATPYSIAGARGQTISFGGLYDPTDAGQEALLDAEAANTPIKIQVLFDGTNGFEQTISITKVGFSTTPEGYQEITFEAKGTTDPVITGTGPIL
jgi:hypothetical protein